MTTYTLRDTSDLNPGDRYRKAFEDLAQVKRDLVQIETFLNEVSLELPVEDAVTGELAFAARYAGIAFLHLLKARWRLAQLGGLEPTEREEPDVR